MHVVHLASTLLVLAAACAGDPASAAGDARLAVEPALLAFADATACDEPPTTIAVVSNVGDSATQVRPRLAGRDAAHFAIASTCDATLPPGASCALTVSVQSRGEVALEAALLVGEGDEAVSAVTAPAAVNGKLEIVEFDGFFGQTFVDLSALHAPRRNVHIRNAGTGALPPLGFALVGDDAFHVLSNTCGEAPLCSRDACVVTVDFRPTKLGAQDTKLSIQAGGATWMDSFTGTGVE